MAARSGGRRRLARLAGGLVILAAAAAPAVVQPFAGTAGATIVGFSTGDPDGKMATASRPGPASGLNVETESADDFTLSVGASISSATFTGLLPATTTTVSRVIVEIYRVFPQDSDTGRTITVPTRANSPSDVEFDDRDSQSGSLTFQTSVLASSFTAANSVDRGIHPSPNQVTGGEGPITGQEVKFSVSFTPGLSLPAGHYFFVPQVLLGSGHFYWLSAPKPIVSPGTPFSPDLQSWIRNDPLSPDWLRVGTDIVGSGTFNAAFSLVIDTPAPGCTTSVSGNVTGPLTVSSGTLCVTNAVVTSGGIVVNQGASVVVTGSSVAGGVTASSPLFVSVCGSRLTPIPTAPTQAISVGGATGPVEVGDSSHGCAPNKTTAGISLLGNTGGVSVNGNQVVGTLTVNNNSGGTVTVGGNVVTATVACSGNVPSPTNGGTANTALGGKTGQCASL